MKKQYIFVIMIFVVLYILYLIMNFKYKEYKIQNHIDNIKSINETITKDINSKKNLLKYKNSKAYKNKILKQQLVYKNKGEKLILLSTEKTYKTYVQKIKPDETLDANIIQKDYKLNNTNIYGKWMFYLFGDK